MDSMKIVKSLNKSDILIQHEAALLEHKTKMNSDADLVVKIGGLNITFKTIDLDGTPTTVPVQLIPINCVDISTLTQNPNVVLDGKYFLCRTIAPSYRSGAIEGIVEDPKGQQGIRISINNYSSLDKCSYNELVHELPVGQILAIKNPWLKSLGQNGGFTLKCDNPEDIVFISASMAQKLFPYVKWEGEIPEKWQKFIQSTPKSLIEWRNQGNKEFLGQKYEKALQSYTTGLNLKDGGETDSYAQIVCDMLSNRAAAYLKLECFQSALDDLEKLLEMDATHFKGLYRKGKALLGLQRFQEAIEFLELSSNLANLDSENQKLFMELLELAENLLKQQTTGEYDIVKLYKAGDDRQADCADFVGPVKVGKISGSRSGHGLVATQDIQPGQLISATKAFQIVFPAEEQGICPGGPDVAVVFNCGSNHPSSSTPTVYQQKLVKDIARKLSFEPNLLRTFYQLYAGPEFPIDVSENDPLVVDLKRIENICHYNIFPSKTVRRFCNCAHGQDKAIGVWILPSFINNRCWEPNAIWMTYGDMLFVRALKEIPIGGEILISSVDPSQLYEERKKVLNAQGYVCDCQLCQIDRDNSNLGRKRMDLLKKIDKEQWEHNAGFQHEKELERMMKKLWNLDKGGQKPNLQLNPSLIYSLHDLAHFFCFSKPDLKKFIDLTIKYHALTTNSVSKKLAVECSYRIIAMHLVEGKIEEAKKWKEIWKKEMMTFYGTLDIAELLAKETLALMRKYNIFLENEVQVV